MGILHKLFGLHDWFRIPDEFLSEEYRPDTFAIGDNKILVCEECGLVKDYHKSLGEVFEKYVGYLDNHKKIIAAIKRIKELEEEEKTKEKIMQLERAKRTKIMMDNLINCAAINKALSQYQLKDVMLYML